MEIPEKAMPQSVMERLRAMKTNIRSTMQFGRVRQLARRAGLALDDDGIEANYVILSELLKAQETCGQCPGRAVCPMAIQGLVPAVEVGPGGELRLYYRPCAKDAPYRFQQRIERLLASSRLPELFKTKTFETFQATDRNRQAIEVAKLVAGGETERGLLLAGPPGTGKTHLAAAIMNYRLAQGKESVFCTVPELLADVRKAMRTEQETTELMEIIKGAEFLVLDDLGAERTSGWVLEQLFILLNARVSRCKQTVVTTNYTSTKDLIRKLTDPKEGDSITGQRIVSRLCEMCDWVLLTGEDWRLTHR